MTSFHSIQVEQLIQHIEQLKKSEEKLFTFLSQIPMGVFIIDKNYQFVFSNHRADELLQKKQYINFDFSKITFYISTYRKNEQSFEPYPYDEFPIVRTLREGIPLQKHDMWIPYNDSVQNLQIFTQPIFNDLTKVVEYAIALFDINKTNFNCFFEQFLRLLITNPDKNNLLCFLTKSICKTLNADRVGFWKNRQNDIFCLKLYSSITDAYEENYTLEKIDFPIYMDSISHGDILAADDALNFDKTKEFRENYFKPLNVYSTLDIPILGMHGLESVICIEVLNNQRRWTDYEITWAKELQIFLNLIIHKYPLY